LKALALLQLFGAAAAVSIPGYDITIPDPATIVSTWEALYGEIKKFPNETLLPRHGSNIIEVDGQIMLATTDTLTREIQAKVDSIPPPTAEQETQYQRMVDAHEKGLDVTMTKQSCSRADGDNEGKLKKRACSTLGCFNSSLCSTYTDCHVCRAGTTWGPGNTQVRGYCI
jgi:hypothetical protein